MAVPEKRTELTVGVFVLIGLVLLAGLIIQFTRFEDWFGGRYHMTIVFEDASGLIKGSEVRMGGARIGKVAGTPQLNKAVEVEVGLSINEGVGIPAGSIFRIDSASLLGDKLVVVIPPDERTTVMLAPDSRHHGSGATGIDALQNNAEIVSRKVVEMMETAEGTITSIDAAVVEIRAASIQVNEAVAKVNRSLLAEQNLERIDQTIENVASLTRQWDQASGEIEPTLAEAREAVTAIKQAAAKAEATLETADQTFTKLQPALAEIPTAVKKFSSTADKAGDALDRMEQGKGLLGTVANDEEVSTDAKVFVRNLRRHGILRYQDKETAEEEDPRDRFRSRRR